MNIKEIEQGLYKKIEREYAEFKRQISDLIEENKRLKEELERSNNHLDEIEGRNVMKNVLWEDKKSYHVLHVGENSIALWDPGMVTEGLSSEKIDSYVFSGKMPGGVMYHNHRLKEADLDHAKRKILEIYLEQSRAAADQCRGLLKIYEEEIAGLTEAISFQE